MKVRNVIGRNEDIVSMINLNNLYPYGVEIVEEDNFFVSLEQEEKGYDCFLVVLDEQGDIEQVFDTKAEALNSWLGEYHQELRESLI